MIDYAYYTAWVISLGTIFVLGYYGLMPHLRERYGLSWVADTDTWIMDEHNKVYGKITGRTRHRGNDQLLINVHTGGNTLTMPYYEKYLKLVSHPSSRIKVFKYVPNHEEQADIAVLTAENHRVKRDNMLNKLYNDMEISNRIDDVVKIQESKNSNKFFDKDKGFQ